MKRQENTESAETRLGQINRQIHISRLNTGRKTLNTTYRQMQGRNTD